NVRCIQAGSPVKSILVWVGGGRDELPPVCTDQTRHILFCRKSTKPHGSAFCRDALCECPVSPEKSQLWPTPSGQNRIAGAPIDGEEPGVMTQIVSKTALVLKDHCRLAIGLIYGNCQLVPARA